MQTNNANQAHLARIIIKVCDAGKKHTIEGKKFSFQDWLLNLTIDKQHLIKGVEVAPDDVVRVIFHTDHTAHVKHVIHNFYEHAERVFGSVLTAQMLDNVNL